jgi:plasmid maintenance system antidote protein VapI
VNEKAALSPEMALRVEKAFGVSMDTLLRMQAHDGYTMRQRAGEIDVKKLRQRPGRDDVTPFLNGATARLG